MPISGEGLDAAINGAKRISSSSLLTLRFRVAMESAKPILLIEDDSETRELLSAYLKSSGYDVIPVRQWAEALAYFRTNPPRIVLLDVMLPGKSGLEICRELRQMSDVPIIILSGRGDVTDRIVGLELGADDYMAKPFEPRELLARMQSVLRRAERQPAAPEPTRLQFKDLEIDSRSRTARLHDQSIPLSTTEFEALWLLARRSGEILSREEIISGLHGTDTELFDRAIDTVVSRLRTKLGDDPQNPSYIRTVRGAGYIFVAPEGI